MTCLHQLRRRRPRRLRQRLQLLCCLLMHIAAARMTAARTTAARAPPRHQSSNNVAADAAADSSTCTRSKHVVLASFGVPQAYHTASLYFASKFPDTAVHHLLLHLGRGTMEEEEEKKEKTASSTAGTFAAAATAGRSPGVVKSPAAAAKGERRRDIHHSAEIDWRAFYRSHGIHRAVVDMSSLDDYHKFRRDYVHSSVNGYEYELLCFARFIGLRDFCTSRGIHQLTWIDADIPIFDPNFLERVCLPRGYSTWALTPVSTFLNTMTCSDIGRFVDFMLDFYARENRHALVRAIQVHGTDDMASEAQVSKQVRLAEPAFAALGIDPKHFSDMLLFSKFLQDTNAMAGSKQEKEGTEGESVIQAIAPSRTHQPPKAYVHPYENGGGIDPYFSQIISIRNNVPQPDSENVCVDENVWNRYYSVRRDDLGAEKKRGPPASTARSRLGLSFNQSGTWVPIAGAHFQGSDCKARLLNSFDVPVAK